MDPLPAGQLLTSPVSRTTRGLFNGQHRANSSSNEDEEEQDELLKNVDGLLSSEALSRSSSNKRHTQQRLDSATVLLPRPSPSSETASEAAGEVDDVESMTPLDVTMEKIGMGKYQWTLLMLCGCGWMADNMWLQCIAVILPRVQEHFDISDNWIGVLSASIFAGMMLGAWGWGSYSDARGRIPAFKLTLTVTSLFGFLAAFAWSFPALCFILFWLGTGVGGSMPTDGTLFLENIPRTSHNLLTALSVFFSFGAVLSSVLGLVIIPKYSCPEIASKDVPCDVSKDNNGWRYMLLALSVVSIAMTLSRLFFFRLHESAKYLVSAGRSSEAVRTVQSISKWNGDGDHETWELKDVVDHVAAASSTSPGAAESNERYEADSETPLGDVRAAVLESELESGRIQPSGGHSPLPSTPPPSSAATTTTPRRPQVLSRYSSRASGRLKRKIDSSLDEFRQRWAMLYEPKWKKTSQLVFMIWSFCAAGYTIFNVFLPKYLEAKIGESAEGTREQSLRDYVFYTVSGMPGSIMGAWLIETRLGRKGSMFFSALLTTLGILVFVWVDSQLAVIASSMAVSLAVTLMYAVIYSYTPEVFETRVRGTACGMAAAVSRLAGITSPVATGLMLGISVSLPLYVSAACFAIAAYCMITLPIETRGRGMPAGAHVAH